jgi:perosamine synthetase
VLHAGGKPVFADIDAGTFNVNPERIKPRFDEHTCALLPVHLYGYPCAMGEIRDFADDRGLKVVEDACQAHGAEYAGRRAGAIGDVGCFSFYPSKNMTVCGDGGMITTNDETVAKLAAKLRDCGRKSQYEHDVVGYTSRLNTVNAAIGRVQLRRLDAWNRKRQEVAGWYDKGLADVEGVICPPRGGDAIKPVYHLYVVRAKRRDKLREHLRARGVATGVHYPLPIPLQPVYVQMYNFKAGDYPLSEQASRECLSLPMGAFLSAEDVGYVCDVIHEFY